MEQISNFNMINVADQHLTVIACSTVIEEMLPLMPENIEYRIIEFSLHSYPEKLRKEIQASINEVVSRNDKKRGKLTILLGYGLCSQALVGIEARRCTLVLPRVDDCIAIFLGSHKLYKQQVSIEPGSFYLTKGWIEADGTILSEFWHIANRFGRDRAERLFQKILANYRRVVLINTGQYEIKPYRDYARNMAQHFQLHYEEIKGSTVLLQKMLNQSWDDEFIVVKPGEMITLGHFLQSRDKTAPALSILNLWKRLCYKKNSRVS
ncbi:MAG: DUF1638 domain-containing protein [Dehalococcoidia bacterium]|nr:DUF1638 domain-containing protein [Dehalococcoidia bacterium]